ncbi:coiled-coil and C2 domain-containing protein 1A isoform X2 [Scleropages formosus]|uniref:Coiled-coil and C2 domain-containing protein 1B n=1 Tax=Scleropages formosus TaxID=113540 RepID=A0A8C9S9X8_SCLFO|nr:coiled-coil and C2 domain-containing protein 1A isoform X2 [Scleropages formosus]
MSRSQNPPAARGQGAARAKQMGLLLDLTPDGGMDIDGNDAELEAELLSLMGKEGPRGKKPAGRAPVPMADIERMAALCMKDLDEEEGDEDGDLEGDADLLAELNEVLEEEDGEEEQKVATPPQGKTPPRPSPTAPSGPEGLEARLTERVAMYQAAISNAKEAGETSKVRRYDRGLKTLQSMLSSVKKGKPINEEEIPPAVAAGGKPTTVPEKEPIMERPPLVLEPASASLPSQKPPPLETPPKPHLLVPPQKSLAVTPDTPIISPLTPSQPDSNLSEAKRLVLSRQREYKVAAIQAKQSGDVELAKRHYLTAKKFDPIVQALDKGETVDIGTLPPPPGDVLVRSPAPPPQSSTQPPALSPVAPPVADSAPAALPAPRSIGEALQQRMERYQAAAEGAKTKGDDRKARMHQRIVKQYQDAIRAHKAGRPVNLSDLPVPPGCPPLQGSEGGEQNFMGVLETAMTLANQDADAEDEEGPGEEVAKPTVRPAAQRAKAPAPPTPGAGSPGSASSPNQGVKLGPKAQQQLDFLLMRRQQFVRAAVRSKQMKDLQGAALHLRNAKGLDQMITAAKGGLPVDISKVPIAPVTEEDYSLAHSRSSPLSPHSSDQYNRLMELLRQQHEKCLQYSQQFTHMSNITETTRFEKLAEECMKNIEILKKAHGKGYPVPRCHTEERTFNIVKIFPELTSNDMVLTIVKGINLPAPAGVSPSDLDASVRFEFPFPSSEEAQRDKTSTVKNTNCPEFKENFKLNINRGHRGFKRVVQTKGIKFEIIHKGGLFKTDKVVGNAQLKLDSLETQCEIRQLIDVLDGRKATEGRLEVRVKIREPLGGPQLQSITERWLVLDPPSMPPAPSPKPKPQNDRVKNANSSHSPPQYKLHSFSLLQYEKEKIERKIHEYKQKKRDPPVELLQQHKDISHQMQWQKAHLDRASPALLAEYDRTLQQLIQDLSGTARKLSSQGNRDAAKVVLSKIKMVEKEMDTLRKKCAM